MLNIVFPEHWIGQGAPTAWPTLSPDLNPLGFYVDGHLDSTIWATEVKSLACNSEYSMDLRWFARILRILFNLQETLTWNPCYRRPCSVHIIFLLILSCRCTFCMSGRAFFLQLLQLASLLINRQQKSLHIPIASIKLLYMKFESNPVYFLGHTPSCRKLPHCLEAPISLIFTNLFKNTFFQSVAHLIK